MKNSKKFSIKKLYLFYGILFIIVSTLFIIFNINRFIMIGAYLLIVIFFAFTMRRSLVSFVELFDTKLDEMIASGDILDKDWNYDDLCSKVMGKLIKLNSIHIHTKTLLSEEKERVEGLVSDIAHQIKTPMTNIKIYQEILSKKLIDDKEEYLIMQLIESQVKKMDFLIQSMLKISELESGIIVLKVENTTVQDSLKTALENILLGAKNKEIEMKVKGNVLSQVCCDNKWTSEALFNILDNAVKYTGVGGKIEIYIEYIGAYTCITISDNGIGIDKENIPKVFKRFFRERKVENNEGVGIGLSLAREIIMKQGGYISVKSESYKGTKFSVFLPHNKSRIGDENDKT